MTFTGDYNAHFRAQLNRLKTENRYRHFVELERVVGRHPVATRHHDGGTQDVTVWCSNDYLGMGHHPDVTSCSIRRSIRGRTRGRHPKAAIRR